MNAAVTTRVEEDATSVLQGEPHLRCPWCGDTSSQDLKTTWSREVFPLHYAECRLCGARSPVLRNTTLIAELWGSCHVIRSKDGTAVSRDKLMSQSDYVII